jgi:hypothetical protein
MMMNNNTIDMGPIERIVSDNVGSNPNLYGKIVHIPEIVGVRRVEIAIYHEQVNRAGDAEKVQKLINEEVLPVAVKIKNDLAAARYNVSDEPNFVLSTVNYDSIFVRFRCALRPAQEPQQQQVAYPGQIAYPGQMYPNQVAMQIDGNGNPIPMAPAYQPLQFGQAMPQPQPVFPQYPNQQPNNIAVPTGVSWAGR